MEYLKHNVELQTGSTSSYTDLNWTEPGVLVWLMAPTRRHIPEITDLIVFSIFGGLVIATVLLCNGNRTSWIVIVVDEGPQKTKS